MPLHDWSDERRWDNVRPLWLTYLLEWVQERLPTRYRAYPGAVPALTVDAGYGKPDVSVRHWDTTPSPGGSTALLEPDLEATVNFTMDAQRAVHVTLEGHLIAALELVSPRNKDRAEAKQIYTTRYLGYLRMGGICC